ncbi:MAG TPA: hypothetical protein VK421_06040 [Pyrinomonadaceae bacterium]|nr:hypothetical protein [Pyrinomonadaceae bacterium]
MPNITANKSIHRYGEIPIPQFTSDVPAVWSANSGTLLSDDSPRTVYNGTDFLTVVYLEVANEFRQVTVTATDAGSAEDTAPLTVYGTFPTILNWGFKRIDEEAALVSLAEDGVTANVRYKNSSAVVGFEAAPVNRSLIDWEEFNAFRAHHRLHLPFFLFDPVDETWHKVRFDQKRFEVERQGYNRHNFPVLMRQYAGPL